MKRNYYIFMFLVLISSLFLYMMFQPWMLRCLFVNYSGMNEVRDNIYISSSADENKINNILNIIEESEKRVSNLWGNKVSQPHVIICTDIEDFYKFGMYKAHGVSRNYPFGSYIIIHPDGINADIISHELCHAELFERVGYSNDSKIPSWFHEGLAMMVYKDFPEMYLKHSNDEKYLGGDFKKLISNEDFYSSPTKASLLYTYSALEVSKWYGYSGGKERLKKLTQIIKDGYGFNTAYEKVRLMN